MIRSSRYCLPLLLVGAVAVCLPAGCPNTNNPDPDGGTVQGGRLKAFESQTAWVEYFRSQASHGLGRGIPRLSRFFAGTATGGLENDALAPAAEAGDDSNGSGDGGESFTGTNLQEAGVDESDVMKSDGEFFYIARGRSMRIVRASPVDHLAEVGKLQFDDYIKEMYLVGENSAIVLGQRSSGYPMVYAAIDIWPPYLVGGQAVIYQVDLTDRANPQVTKTVNLDGYFVSSRVTNGRLIVVLSIVPDLANRSAAEVNRLTMADVMPKMEIEGESRDMVPWESWLYPESPDGYYMTAVVTLDAANIADEVASVAVLGSAGTVYASTEALYLTDTSYDMSENYRSVTTVHKFAFDENGGAQYVASGSVDGRPLNQFSLGEYQDNLRIATHIDPRFITIEPAVDGDDNATSISVAPEAASNSVFVLGQSGGDLVVTGKIEGIAPGEQLYSARFMGARGYLVTFRQVDPLFALDLADPANPRVAGELKVPGFSDYLHLIDDTHIVGVGRSTATSPWGGTVVRGVQLSLFDVSDPANPLAVQQLELGGYGSYTEVSHNHKAFAYLRESGTLAIAATLYPDDYDPYSSNPSFIWTPPTTKVLAYHVDPAVGFTELGRLNAAAPPSDFGYWYFSEWTRPALIGSQLYAVNAIGVRSAPLGDFTALSSLDLANLGEDYDFFPTNYAGDGGMTDDAGGGSGGNSGAAEATQSGR